MINTLNSHGKDWCWSSSSNTLATWCTELTHLKRPWCWERLKAGGEANDRGWDGWMASLTQWTWIWVGSGSCWWTGNPALYGVTKSQTRLSDWTELNWTDGAFKKKSKYIKDVQIKKRSKIISIFRSMMLYITFLKKLAKEKLLKLIVKTVRHIINVEYENFSMN